MTAGVLGFNEQEFALSGNCCLLFVPVERLGGPDLECSPRKLVLLHNLMKFLHASKENFVTARVQKLILAPNCHAFIETFEVELVSYLNISSDVRLETVSIQSLDSKTGISVLWKEI